MTASFTNLGRPEFPPRVLLLQESCSFDPLKYTSELTEISTFITLYHLLRGGITPTTKKFLFNALTQLSRRNQFFLLENIHGRAFSKKPADVERNSRSSKKLREVRASPREGRNQAALRGPAHIRHIHSGGLCKSRPLGHFLPHTMASGRLRPDLTVTECFVLFRIRLTTVCHSEQI